MNLWSILGWIVWVMVLLIGTTTTLKLPNDRETEILDDKLSRMGAVGEVERRVLGWLLIAGCLFTLVVPVSKLHLLWWPFAAWGIWFAMIAFGPRLLVLSLLAFWGFRLFHLGAEAWPGNFRTAAALAIGVGAAGSTLGPTRSFGAWSKRGGIAMIVAGVMAFVISQFF